MKKVYVHFEEEEPHFTYVVRVKEGEQHPTIDEILVVWRKEREKKKEKKKEKRKREEKRREKLPGFLS